MKTEMSSGGVGRHLPMQRLSSSYHHPRRNQLFGSMLTAANKYFMISREEGKSEEVALQLA